MKREIVRAVLRISVTYAIVAGAWIVLSDRLLALLVRDPVLNLQLQTYKGWAFFLVTAILLFLVL